MNDSLDPEIRIDRKDDRVLSSETLTLMQESFARALACCPEAASEAYYLLAGEMVRFTIVGRRLAERLRLPLAHLQNGSFSGQTSSLNVELWDEKETGVECPGRSSGMIATPALDSHDVGYRFHSFIVYLDRKRKHMVGSIANGDALSLYEQGRPLHPPLAQWLNDQGVPLIHAGLVANEGKGVLLAGASGSGKSTTAITCLQAGYQYVGDDLVGLQVLSDGSFIGHSLYNSTYVEAPHLDRFPHLKPHAIEGVSPKEAKPLVLLSQIYGERLVRAAVISVIALPRITHAARCKFFPAPKSKALFALVPSSRKINKSLGAAEFESLVRLVERVPCYWLDLAENLDEIPGCIEKLLAEVS